MQILCLHDVFSFFLNLSQTIEAILPRITCIGLYFLFLLSLKFPHTLCKLALETLPHQKTIAFFKFYCQTILLKTLRRCFTKYFTKMRSHRLTRLIQECWFFS